MAHYVYGMEWLHNISINRNRKSRKTLPHSNCIEYPVLFYGLQAFFFKKACFESTFNPDTGGASWKSVGISAFIIVKVTDFVREVQL